MQWQLTVVYPWPVFLLISSFGIPDTLLIINELIFTPAQKEMKNKLSFRFRQWLKILIKEDNTTGAAIKKSWLKRKVKTIIEE